MGELRFYVDWYDSTSTLTKKYLLAYHVEDGTAEMHDLKNNRPFLKRTKVNVKPSNLFIGGSVDILSRHLQITGYADTNTQNCLGSVNEKALVIIDQNAIPHMGKIISELENQSMQLVQMKSAKLSHSAATSIFGIENKEAIEIASSGWCLMIEVLATSVNDSLSGVSQHDGFNMFSSSMSTSFFSTITPTTSIGVDSTCCVIRPHAVSEGRVGVILDKIVSAGFEVSAVQSFLLDRVNGEEFLEVYKGVVHEYGDTLTELCSGICIALEIRAENAVETFRTLAGPRDPNLARVLRPRTLRAWFGSDKVCNAVHCTDLPEDGASEVEYFFKILSD